MQQNNNKKDWCEALWAKGQAEEPDKAIYIIKGRVQKKEEIRPVNG